MTEVLSINEREDNNLIRLNNSHKLFNATIATGNATKRVVAIYLDVKKIAILKNMSENNNKFGALCQSLDLLKEQINCLCGLLGISQNLIVNIPSATASVGESILVSSKGAEDAILLTAKEAIKNVMKMVRDIIISVTEKNKFITDMREDKAKYEAFICEVAQLAATINSLDRVIEKGRKPIVVRLLEEEKAKGRRR